MEGLLLVDKPQGWTSFDVVAKVRGTLKKELQQKLKVGHTGTLDPLATGLLVLAIGKATKQVPLLTKQDKVYEAQITLGHTSATDDAEGELTAVSDRCPTLAEITAALQSFIGDIEQIPPQFSAIKTGGVKSYDAARKGQVVEHKARAVTIYSIDKITYEYPHISCVVHVGSGTYIRSLARDVGNSLGTGGYLSALRRTKVGPFDVADALQVSNCTVEKMSESLRSSSIS